MATVYLHIGLPKTGTTALQTFLTANAAVLERHGICYPDLGLRYSGVSFRRNAHFLVQACVDKDGVRDVNRVCPEYNDTLDRIGELGKCFKQIILADEAIWRFSGSRKNFWPRIKGDFQKRGFDLRIVVYLRRQDTFVQSLYCQKIKASSTCYCFEDFLEKICKTGYPLDFSTYLDTLSEVFGKENLIVRVYEKGQYQGKEKTLFSDFLSIFGLSVEDGFEVKPGARNISLNGTYLELRRLMNALPTSPKELAVLRRSVSEVISIEQKADKAQKMLQRTAANTPLKQTQKSGSASIKAPSSAADISYFAPGEQARFLAQFAASNERVAREYLHREDGKLFYDEVKDLPTYEVDMEKLLQDTILVYGNAVQKLEQKNAELVEEISELRKELRKEIRDVRENVLLYRLKRKLRKIFNQS